MNATTNAEIVAAFQGSSANVAPVIRIDSPSAMMMKSAQRSAICAPSICQSVVFERPRPGTQKAAIGETYSMASAMAQIQSRVVLSAKAPAIQNGAAAVNQRKMRVKLRKFAASWSLSTHSMNPVRPSCMKT